MYPARVLLIDDDPYYARRARSFFDVDNHIDLRVVTTATAASVAIEQWRPNIVILDLLLADSCSFALLDALRSRRRTSRIGVICLAGGAGSCEAYHHCTDGGQFLGVLRRDAGPEALLHAVAIAVSATCQPAATT
jgi:ActR/RegA family two-component response regulator